MNAARWPVRHIPNELYCWGYDARIKYILIEIKSHIIYLSAVVFQQNYHPILDSYFILKDVFQLYLIKVKTGMNTLSSFSLFGSLLFRNNIELKYEFICILERRNVTD